MKSKYFFLVLILFFNSMSVNAQSQAEKNVQIIKNNEEAIKYICLLGDSKKLLSVTISGRISIWDIDSGQYIKDISIDREYINAVIISKDGKLVLTCGDSVRLWEDDFSSYKIISSLINRPLSGAISKDKRRMALGTRNIASLVVLNIEDSKMISGMVNTYYEVNSIFFLTDTNYLIFSFNNQDGGRIGIWNSKEIKIQRLFPQFPKAFKKISMMIISEDEKKAYFVSEDSKINGINIETGELILSFYYYDNINRIVLSPDGKIILTCTSDGFIQLWDSTTGALIAETIEQTLSVNDAIFYSNGEYIISCSDDGKIRIINSEDLSIKQVMSLK